MTRLVAGKVFFGGYKVVPLFREGQSFALGDPVDEQAPNGVLIPWEIVWTRMMPLWTLLGVFRIRLVMELSSVMRHYEW